MTRVSEDAGVYHDGDAYVCPLCTSTYVSVSAAAACDCDSDD